MDLLLHRLASVISNSRVVFDFKCFSPTSTDNESHFHCIFLLPQPPSRHHQRLSFSSPIPRIAYRSFNPFVWIATSAVLGPFWKNIFSLALETMVDYSFKKAKKTHEIQFTKNTQRVGRVLWSVSFNQICMVLKGKAAARSRAPSPTMASLLTNRSIIPFIQWWRRKLAFSITHFIYALKRQTIPRNLPLFWTHL